MVNKKQDYSKFYISMILILCALLIGTTIYSKYEMYQHSLKDLNFAKQTGEFIVFQAEIIGYCADKMNVSNEDLLTSFLKYKSDEIIKETFNEGKGLEYDVIFRENK